MKNPYTKIVIVFAAAAILFLSGCKKADGNQVAALAETLILEFNEENARDGFLIRDYTYPSPGIAWKHCYSVMDEQYELEEVERGSYLLHTTLTEYVSVESALSPEEAGELTEHTVSDILQAVTQLQFQNGEWRADGPSEVYSQKRQEWTRKRLFRPEIVTGPNT